VSGARAAAGDLVLAFPEPEMGGPDRGDAADPAFVDALVDAVEGDRRRDPGRRAVVAVAGAGRSAAALMARRPDVFGRCAVLPAAAGWANAVCALESGWARAV
jgi:poly(3-hydroxybutyrate) depolymerase